MTKKIYERKCLNCKDKFTPTSNTQSVCSFNCSMEYAKNKVKTDKLKISRLETKKMRDSIIGIPELKKLLETQINTICREIDKGSGCVSCGGHTTPQAGHYHTVQSNGSIRFNLFNTHLQDFNCNCAKGGNIHNYDLGLIKMYGKEYWEYVKFQLPQEYPVLKLTKPELLEAIAKSKELVKRLKKANITHSMQQRIRLRSEYNNFIGIYTKATPTTFAGVYRNLKV